MLQGDRPGTLRAIQVLGDRRKCPRGHQGTGGPPQQGGLTGNGLWSQCKETSRGEELPLQAGDQGGDWAPGPMRVAPPSSGFLPRYRRTHRPSSGALRSGRCAGQTPNSPPARLPAGGGQGWELVTRVPRLCVEHAASHLRPMFTIILRSRLPETGQRGTPTPAAPGRVSPPFRAAPRHRLLPPRNSCSTAPASGFPGRGASLTEAHVTKDLPP